MERYGTYASGHAGSCGLFSGDGTSAPGAGLCGAGYQRGRRCAGAYGDFVETVEKVPRSGLPFYQQDGSGRDGQKCTAVRAEDNAG